MFDPQSIQANSDPKNSIKETDFPIHSMENDLEKIKKNPAYDPTDFSSEKSEFQNQSNEKKLTAKEKTSPFLQNPVPKPNPEPIKFESSPKPQENKSQPPTPPANLEKNLAPEPKKEIESQRKMPPQIPVMPQEEKILGDEKPKSKIIIPFIVVLVIIIVGGLGFYYYQTIKEGQSIEVSSSPEIIENETEIEIPKDIPPADPKTETLQGFSLENPNFLILDQEGNATETIQHYSQKVSDLDPKSLIEFVPVNANYEPTNLETFFSSMSSTLYPEILSSMNNEENQLSLFIYRDTDETNLALSIPLKKELSNEELLKNLESKESQLLKDFSFLLADQDIQSATPNFQSSSYKNIDLRYFNLKPEGELSFDYFIVNNNLVFATSKNSALSIVDKIQTEAE